MLVRKTAVLLNAIQPYGHISGMYAFLIYPLYAVATDTHE
jgi:hypothetical protein